jgi:hypothetical protein
LGYTPRIRTLGECFDRMGQLVGFVPYESPSVNICFSSADYMQGESTYCLPEVPSHQKLFQELVFSSTQEKMLFTFVRNKVIRCEDFIALRSIFLFAGWDYFVQEPHKKVFKPKNYSKSVTFICLAFDCAHHDAISLPVIFFIVLESFVKFLPSRLRNRLYNSLFMKTAGI